MFFDWLTIEQDFGYQLPLLGDVAYQRLRVDTGEVGALSQPKFKHAGSFCDVVTVSIRGSILRIEGNPSRWGRLDNLFGLPTVDSCVSVFNGICHDLGLPAFTKCTRLDFMQVTDGSQRNGLVSDGALIRELHITSNVSVGQGNQLPYLSGLSTQTYRNSVPRLHSNGRSVDWLSKKGAANLIYPTVYDKAHELALHSADKIKRNFGEHSAEYAHILKIIDYCNSVGLVRFEQKLKSRYLQKHSLIYWGLSDYSVLNQLHDEFINLDKKLSVTAMDFETISERLISSGVVDTTRAANTTAMYAIQWMHGHTFDFNKKQVKTHRARLRRVGIDINQPCNIARFSPVFVRETREVNPVVLSAPSWYAMPRHLRVA